MSKQRRYTPDYDVVAYRSIALCGIDRAAWESIGITERAFYKWMSEHDSFRESVTKAREFHAKASPEALRLALITHIANTLEAGGEVIHTRQRVVTRTTQRDRRNQILFVTETETVTETDESRGLPKWISDKIMANATGVGEAIAKLLNSGYEVYKVAGDEQALLAAGKDNNSRN